MVLQPAMSRKRTHSSAHRHFLVILDMNGVLLVRTGTKRQNAHLRPHIERFLATLWELRDHVTVAVWSSMVRRNLEPLVHQAFGEKSADLAFIWDQDWCTHCRVPGMHKPLLRKDLSRLRSTPWASYAPDHLLLVDDDPIKCTQNPAGTAVHPSSFTGASESDSELLRLAAYVQALASSSCGSVRQFVKSHPYDSFHEELPVEPPCKRLRADVGGESAAAPSFASWEAVEAFSEEFDEWYPASVVQLLEDGSVHIRWDGGDESTDSVLPPESVRAAREQPAEGAQPWRRVESRTRAGVYYYYNDSTGETQVEPPDPWERRESRTKPGTFYYWNRLSGLTSAEKPDLLD
uniref:Mitochondrial import inner membrane translocase subunit TIM50 n=1 Tax=Alexandrium monilatum TaxID=311494 RepID=A0A7S4PTS8_9DINO